MIESLALIFLAGLAASALCRKLKIPPVSGMLLTGIVLGPYVLNLLSPSILAVFKTKKIQPNLIAEFPFHCTVDYSDDNFRSGAYIRPVQVAANHLSLFITGSKMDMKIGLAIFC